MKTKAKRNSKNEKKKFASNTKMVYNIIDEKVDQNRYLLAIDKSRYLPTDDLPFKKMLASPDKIHIAEGMLVVIEKYDPLQALKVGRLAVDSPYNFKDINQLEDHSSEFKGGIRYTEVDLASSDILDPKRFLMEMQNHSESYLEMRNVYNVSVKFTSSYAGDSKKSVNYDTLESVISIVILRKSHFDDNYPIRYLRPHDARIDAYKKDLNLGLEIYLELDKNTSGLPPDLQELFEFFRTGLASEDAPEFLQEAADMMKRVNFTPEERRIADAYIYNKMKRDSEDAYVRDEGREEGRLEERAKYQEERAKYQKDLAKHEDEKRELNVKVDEAEQRIKMLEEQLRLSQKNT